MDTPRFVDHVTAVLANVALLRFEWRMRILISHVQEEWSLTSFVVLSDDPLRTCSVKFRGVLSSRRPDDFIVVTKIVSTPAVP